MEYKTRQEVLDLIGVPEVLRPTTPSNDILFRLYGYYPVGPETTSTEEPEFAYCRFDAGAFGTERPSIMEAAAQEIIRLRLNQCQCPA